MGILFGNDEILMLTILSLKDEAYGVTIMKHLTEITGREWSIGAIYDPLYRLEKNGFVRSDLTMPTKERGGRSKRVYKVSDKGIEALKQHKNVREGLYNRLSSVVL